MGNNEKLLGILDDTFAVGPAEFSDEVFAANMRRRYGPGSALGIHMVYQVGTEGVENMPDEPQPVTSDFWWYGVV